MLLPPAHTRHPHQHRIVLQLLLQRQHPLRVGELVDGVPLHHKQWMRQRQERSKDIMLLQRRERMECQRRRQLGRMMDRDMWIKLGLYFT